MLDAGARPVDVVVEARVDDRLGLRRGDGGRIVVAGRQPRAHDLVVHVQVLRVGVHPKPVDDQPEQDTRSERERHDQRDAWPPVDLPERPIQEELGLLWRPASRRPASRRRDASTRQGSRTRPWPGTRGTVSATARRLEASSACLRLRTTRHGRVAAHLRWRCVRRLRWRPTGQARQALDHGCYPPSRGSNDTLD